MEPLTKFAGFEDVADVLNTSETFSPRTGNADEIFSGLSRELLGPGEPDFLSHDRHGLFGTTVSPLQSWQPVGLHGSKEPRTPLRSRCGSSRTESHTGSSLQPPSAKRLSMFPREVSSAASSSRSGTLFARGDASFTGHESSGRFGRSNFCSSGSMYSDVVVNVKVPGGGLLGLRLDLGTRVGPLPQSDPDWFEQYWGEGAEQRGPFSARSRSSASSERRALPLPKALKALEERLIQPQSARASYSENRFASLKELVEAATGVAVDQQKLCFELRGPLEDDSQTLGEVGIRDGSTVILRHKPVKVALTGAPRFEDNPLLQCPEATPDSVEFLSERSKDMLRGVLCPPRPEWKVGHVVPLRLDSSVIGKKLRLRQTNKGRTKKPIDNVHSPF
eukprot:gb/GFBE01059582.1/.p1 GENE.gb/GFBE01059582.1/~~gb/GFBE01059582.1/.p1  ORF type:complete len:391 (+),score=53.41 gb/GFBE01059582.1/:1-1173(+)